MQTCTAAFATKDRLRTHMVRHEGKVSCNICGKLLSAAYITSHLKTHGQSQSINCNTCKQGISKSRCHLKLCFFCIWHWWNLNVFIIYWRYFHLCSQDYISVYPTCFPLLLKCVVASMESVYVCWKYTLHTCIQTALIHFHIN